MPLFKCDACHHEWEGGKKRNKCDWCGESAHVLAKETGLEILCKQLFKQRGKHHGNRQMVKARHRRGA